MPTNLVYVDPWLLFALLLLAGIGIERLFVDVVRFVDRHWFREKKEAPAPPVFRIVSVKGEPVIQNPQNEKARRFLSFRGRR